MIELVGSTLDAHLANAATPNMHMQQDAGAAAESAFRVSRSADPNGNNHSPDLLLKAPVW
jgi:hypothetical protein